MKERNRKTDKKVLNRQVTKDEIQRVDNHIKITSLKIKEMQIKAMRYYLHESGRKF